MRRFVTLLVVSVIVARPAPAQTPRADSARVGPRGCTYDACALRLTHRRWSSKEFLVRGTTSDSTREPLSYAALSRAVEGSPAAMRELRHVRGWHSVAKGVVIASVIAGIAVGVNIVATSENKPIGVVIATVAAPATVLAGTVVALPALGVGDYHMRKAVREWNRELPR